MKKNRMKYFSFDKIPYLYESLDNGMGFEDREMLDPDLKIAG